jgi:hypothetical protein
MLGYGGTKRRKHRKVRGGLTKEEETDFLAKKQAADREEALTVGSKAMHEKSPAVEGTGTGTKKPKVSAFQQRQTEVARAESEGKEPPPAGGRRRRHSRRKTHRRRR